MDGIDGSEVLVMLEVDDNDDDIERRALLLASQSLAYTDAQPRAHRVATILRLSQQHGPTCGDAHHR